MSSVSSSYKQRASKSLVALASAKVCTKAALETALAAATRVSESVYTASSLTNFNAVMTTVSTAIAAGTSVTAGNSVSDLGQTLVLHVPSERFVAEFQLVQTDKDVSGNNTVVAYALTKLYKGASTPDTAITFVRI